MYTTSRESPVEGLSPRKLAAFVKRARRAGQLNKDLQDKAKAAADAKLFAEHVAWLALLDVRAEAATAGRRNADLAKAFQFLIDAIARKK